MRMLKKARVRRYICPECDGTKVVNRASWRTDLALCEGCGYKNFKSRFKKSPRGTVLVSSERRL